MFKVNDIVVNGQGLIFKITWKSNLRYYFVPLDKSKGQYLSIEEVEEDGHIRKLTKLEKALK